MHPALIFRQLRKSGIGQCALTIPIHTQPFYARLRLSARGFSGMRALLFARAFHSLVSSTTGWIGMTGCGSPCRERCVVTLQRDVLSEFGENAGVARTICTRVPVTGKGYTVQFCGTCRVSLTEPRTVREMVC